MSNIEDVMNKPSNEGWDGDETSPPVSDPPQGQGQGEPSWQKILTAAPGPGAIEDYLIHPLNFRKSEGLGQIIRGLTGILGSLEYALVDVFMGFLKEFFVKQEA